MMICWIKSTPSLALSLSTSYPPISRILSLPTHRPSDGIHALQDTLILLPSSRGDSVAQNEIGTAQHSIVPFEDSSQISNERYVYQDSIFPIDGHVASRLGMLDSMKRTSHWHTDLITGFSKLIPIDSSLLFAHLYDPTLTGPYSKTNLGIDFAATLPDVFADRPKATSQTPLFAHALLNLFPLASGIDTYAANGPFSQIVLMSNFSTQHDQLTGRLFFTQNVTPSTNLGFTFDHNDETGEYTNFQTRANAFSAFGSYAANRLYINMSIGFAEHKFKDYGGLANDSDQLNTDLKRQETSVRLSTPHAQTTSQAASALFEYDVAQHRHTLPDSLGIQYVTAAPLLSLTSAHHFRAYYRGFNETYGKDEQRARFLSNTSAIDSVGQQTYTGTIGVRLHQLRHAQMQFPGIRAGVGYQLDRYIQQRAHQYLTGKLDEIQHSLFIEAALEYELSHLSVQAFSRSYLLGGKLGNTLIQAEAAYFPLKRTKQYELRAAWYGEFASQHPFYLYYRSNRFIWDNTIDFKQSFASTLHAAFAASRWGGEYGVNNSTITNYTYLNSNAIPAQIANLNVLEVYIQQIFARWGLSLLLRGSWQRASRNVAAVPAVTAYGNLAYQFQVVKDALQMRFGVEVFYRTRFYAPGYNTDLGVFYAQRSVAIGNYPMLNAFLSLKWKSANVFVRVFNVAQGAYGYNFFAAPHYPDRKRSFRLGVNWYFYN